MNLVTSSPKSLLLQFLLLLVTHGALGWPWPSLGGPSKAVGRGTYITCRDKMRDYELFDFDTQRGQLMHGNWES